MRRHVLPTRVWLMHDRRCMFFDFYTQFVVLICWFVGSRFIMASTSSSKSKSQRKQMFREEYSTRWPCIIRSKLDDFTARCTVCQCDFTISHGGANDITAHIKRKKHLNLAQSRETNQNIGHFFRRGDYSTIRAETLMANFLIEHNLPFAETGTCMYLACCLKQYGSETCIKWSSIIHQLELICI